VRVAMPEPGMRVKKLPEPDAKLPMLHELKYRELASRQHGIFIFQLRHSTLTHPLTRRQRYSLFLRYRMGILYGSISGVAFGILRNAQNNPLLFSRFPRADPGRTRGNAAPPAQCDTARVGG
jgi:hypothetical protein